MAVNVPGTVALVLFYIAILVVGIIAGRKTSQNQTNESIMVADRSLGFLVSFCTITATMEGGAFINGTAESVSMGGLLHAQTPIGFSFSLMLAAFTFLPPMRKAGYLTMIDPFQLKYGRKVGALMAIPQVIGDLFWSAAIFHALGKGYATSRELRWAMRISIIAAAVVSTLIALFSKTVYGIFVLSADLMYVILFPQLAAVLWLPFSNAYGSLAGYFVALSLRMLTGESLLGIPAAIHFPLYDGETKTQNFPYRTFAMVAGAVTLVLVSMATNAIFQYNAIPMRFDVLKCTDKRPAGVRQNVRNGAACSEDNEMETGLIE